MFLFSTLKISGPNLPKKTPKVKKHLFPLVQEIAKKDLGISIHCRDVVNTRRLDEKYLKSPILVK